MAAKNFKAIYPDNWKSFSRGIREDRAGLRCECIGECGLHKTTGGPRRCEEIHMQPAKWARGRVILTTAHLCDCDPLCVIAEHVKAMCNRCHLTILTPFMGVGSEVYGAIINGRRGIGMELKPSYYRQAQKNIRKCIEQGRIGIKKSESMDFEEAPETAHSTSLPILETGKQMKERV